MGIWALVAASMISNIGNGLTTLAIPWFVLVTTGSAARTGLTGAIGAVAVVLAGLFGGTLVDRIGFKRASIISDFASMITIALIPALYLTDLLQFWMLLVLVFLGAILDVPGWSARQALVPRLARQAKMTLERANSAMQLATSLGTSLIGPLVAGILIGSIGVASVLFIDAGTFAASILIILVFVRVRSRVVEDSAASDEVAEEDGYLADVWEGMRFMFRDRVLTTMAPVAVLFNCIIAALFGVTLPVYVRETFGGAGALGLLMAAFGVGAILGTIVYGSRGERYGRYNLFMTLFALSTTAIWLLALVPVLAVNVVAMFLLGLAVAPIGAVAMVIFQIRVPERLLGRVLGAITAFYGVATPLGILIGGLAIEWTSVRVVMYSAAATMILLPAIIYFRPFSWLATAEEFDEVRGASDENSTSGFRADQH